MFSFNNPKRDKRQVCTITGGKYDGKIVYLNGDKDNDDGQEYYDFDEMTLKGDAKFLPAVDTTGDQQEVIAFFGPMGSGKSFLMKKYLEEYKKAYPYRGIYLISKKVKDPTLDSVQGLKRVRIDETIVTDPIPYEVFKDSAVVLDDIDTFKSTTKADKLIRNTLMNLKADFLELGRDLHVTSLVSSHLACKSHETKTLLNEANRTIIYPSSGANYTYLLNKYFGFDTKQIKRIKEFDSRWVCLCRKAPQCLFTERQIMSFKDV
jgi:hypothetical protein